MSTPRVRDTQMDQLPATSADNEPLNGTIALLADDVARKIAAGEIIDRPMAVVRELLDNSLDAGADDITLVLEDGGIRSIRVVDNGRGMNAANLKLATLPHATSKIRSVEDLKRVASLGFRGEALPSIAAVSRMTITSNTRERNSTGNRLSVAPDGTAHLTAHGAIPGTTVEARDLFYNLPARKRFLRHSSVENRLCRSIFIEKSLPFPAVSMRLLSGTSLRLFLPPGSLAERVISAHNTYHLPGDRMHTLSASSDHFKLTIIAAEPTFQFHDRKLIQIFLNHRRLSIFGLTQAIEYAFNPYIPGGLYPAAFVFIEIDPAFVDFNIHPAKREARIREMGEIRQLLSRTLDSFLHNYTLRLTNAAGNNSSGKMGSAIVREDTMANANAAILPDIVAEQPLIDFSTIELPKNDIASRPLADLSFLAERPGDPKRRTAPNHSKRMVRIARAASVTAAARPQTIVANVDEIHYIGQIFNLFLLAQLHDRMLIVDQHAGHEKLLYVRYRRKQQPQELLIPIPLELGAEEESYVQFQLAEWEKMGLRLTRHRAGQWSIVALPQSFVGHEQMLVESLGEALGPQRANHDFFAYLACHTAVRAGDRLDGTIAAQLLRDILSLDDGHCPHGRPVWIEISLDQLMRLVSRF